MSNADAFGKAGYSQKRQSYSPRPERARRWALDGIVCNVAAGAAFLFLVALVLGLIGH